MRSEHRWIWWIATVLLMVACARGGAQTGVTGSLSVSELYLFRALNQERAEHSLAPVTWNPVLADAARTHAGWMANARAISHQFKGEPDLSTRAAAVGARFSTIAENVAVAPTAVAVHDAWMHSPGHRANILDPMVTAVGIAVVVRGQDLWAVQDFSREVRGLSLDQQEAEIVSQLGAAGVTATATDDARKTCSMMTNYAGARRPAFVMRYSSTDLSRMPEQLTSRMQRGGFSEAAVGACVAKKSSSFTTYTIAVVLYP